MALVKVTKEIEFYLNNLFDGEEFLNSQPEEEIQIYLDWLVSQNIEGEV